MAEEQKISTPTLSIKHDDFRKLFKLLLSNSIKETRLNSFPRPTIENLLRKHPIRGFEDVNFDERAQYGKENNIAMDNMLDEIYDKMRPIINSLIPSYGKDFKKSQKK